MTQPRQEWLNWLDDPRYRFWFFQVLGWSIYTLVKISATSAVTQDHAHPIVLFAIAASLNGLIITGLMAGVYARISHVSVPILLMTAFLAIVVGSLMFVVADHYALMLLEQPRPHHLEFWEPLPHATLKRAYILAAWSGLYFGAHFYRQSQIERENAVKAAAAADHAELEMLRYQLQPHLLFNALNTVSGLIVRDKRDEAEQMVQNISLFLRQMLKTRTNDPVTLEEEVAFVERYLKIETVRFKDRLSVNIDIAPDTGLATVPPFILQPLVENSIKYGLSAHAGKTSIFLTALRDGPELKISFRTKLDSEEHTLAMTVPSVGLGEKNVRDRLRLHYGNAAGFQSGRQDNGDYLVTITVPFIAHEQKAAQ